MNVKVNVRRLVVAALVVSVNLGGLSGGVALAQNGPVDVDIDSGVNGGYTTSGPPSDQVTFCKDLSPGRGSAVNSPGADAKDVDVAPAPEPAPETEPAPESSTDNTAVASPTDQDADNAPDELEPGQGLDPTNPDTDGDHVADGDEINIYGTDPLAVDTDGDGAGDGEELFATHTDPLVSDSASAQGSESTTAAS